MDNTLLLAWKFYYRVTGDINKVPEEYKSEVLNNG